MSVGRCGIPTWEAKSETVESYSHAHPKYTIRKQKSQVFFFVSDEISVMYVRSTKSRSDLFDFRSISFYIETLIHTITSQCLQNSEEFFKIRN